MNVLETIGERDTAYVALYIEDENGLLTNYRH